MKFIYFTCIILAFSFLIASCCKTPVTPPTSGTKKILVDASKDGGGWWYPQSPPGGFNANAEHQGKKLADYFRSLGYQVDELPRGAVITTALLNNYTKVIRADVYDSYSLAELQAYDAFLSKNNSLLLIADYLRDHERDVLSERLGLKFEGAYTGTINRFEPHAITSGVASINYIAGSTVTNGAKNSNIKVLGWFNSNLPVMGILHHPTSKIFFIGDINGIEEVPQPFVSNLSKWLF